MNDENDEHEVNVVNSSALSITKTAGVTMIIEKMAAVCAIYDSMLKNLKEKQE